MLKPKLMLVLAPIILIVGAVSLIFAAERLLLRALDLGLPMSHLWWILPLSVVAGACKARFVMRRRMLANIRRLSEATGSLWIWQVYPPQLLAFIISMVITMFILKRVLAENPLGLGLLGGADLAVAVALFVASREYRNP